MKLSDDSILSALIAYGSPAAAAKALGCSTQPIYTRLRNPEFKAKAMHKPDPGRSLPGPALFGPSCPAQSRSLPLSRFVLRRIRRYGPHLPECRSADSWHPAGTIPADPKQFRSSVQHTQHILCRSVQPSGFLHRVCK